MCSSCRARKYEARWPLNSARRAAKITAVPWCSVRIALVSYEFSGAQSGGIGTYFRNTAEMLTQRDADVEIFTASTPDTSPKCGIVHAIPVKDKGQFADAVLPVFAERHKACPFDVVEAREYGADAAAISRAFPDVPLVVKLAMAGFLIGEINDAYIGWPQKLRFIAGGLRRGQIPKPYWGNYEPARDLELKTTLCAHEVTSPSRALVDATLRRWPLEPARTVVIPHVFVAPEYLLDLPVDGVGTRRITFVGKMEVRKGVLELARAIPMVLAEFPDAQFRFVGPSLPMPGSGRDLTEHIREMLSAHRDRIEYTGALGYRAAMQAWADSDIAVFPSYWEAYGFVCLEAMAAARGVIGSSAGGMAEIIEHGRTGLLVPPRNPKAIADAILALLRDPDRRVAMGRAARAHVATAYASDVIGPLQEASYRRAIARAKVRQGGLNP